MTHLALSDHLYTNIHTNLQHFKGVYFSGKVVGKLEKVVGSGSYKGRFRGTKSARKTKAKFGFKVRGFCKSMGFNVKYSGVVSGRMSVHGKYVAVHAGYNSSASGTVYGKPLKGTATGIAVFIAAYKSFYYREKGTVRLYIAGKLITAKYIATLNKNAINVAVYGTYDGKKFFFKYSFSLNLLELGLDMNPMMFKRNYGTVYLTVGGKAYTKKYDVNGMQLPKLA